MKRFGSLFIAVLIIVAGISAVEIFDSRHELADAYRRWRQGPVPGTVSRAEIKRDLAGDDETVDWSRMPPDENAPEVAAGAPVEGAEAVDNEAVFHPDEAGNPPILNLFVPFAVQSPYAEWTDVDKEACEEASMIMLKGYLDDTPDFTPDELRAMIDEIVAYENATFGYFEDTTAEETAGVMLGFLDIAAKVVPIASLDDVRDRIAAGDPVLLPAYGKALGNPYFRNGGPLYHMLVAKGYTATHIIVNDPGTKRGEDFLYANDVLWNALGDWNGGDPEHGEKVMIVAE